MKEIASQITLSVSHVVEITAAAIIGIAIIKVAIKFCMQFRIRRNLNKLFFQPALNRPEKLRAEFGSSVAVALELMLGADVLATAVAPSWNEIGQLAAIAVIRTALNYFLGKELKEIRVLSS